MTAEAGRLEQRPAAEAPNEGHEGSAEIRTGAHPVAGGTDTTILGVLLFIASEAMFFAGLFAAYFTLRTKATTWPPGDIHLDLPLAAALTVVLVSSSFTMEGAVRAIQAGDRRRMVRWLSVTLGLGLLFLAGQLYDYATLDFSFSSGVYGAAFFTMTGFHGAHVAGGVVAMFAMLGRASQGQFTARHHAAVVGVSAYWHFVDLIWVALFSTLYLLR
ncbi:MAG TPA: cytochrome c oxidase subunit 3 [Candidatus Limnocylindrales bacterium]